MGDEQTATGQQGAFRLTEEDVRRIAAEVGRHQAKPGPDAPEKLQQVVDILTGAGLCAIVFTFAGTTEIRFASRFTNNPGESQFEIAGREALAIARKLRDARLEQQLKIQPGG